MFGLPDHHSLSETVAQLTRPHTRKVGELDGIEPALLDLLASAIGNTSGRGSAPGGSTRAGAPLDVTALSLWTSISAVVSEHWPGHGDLARADTSLPDRLEQWTSHLAGSDHEVYLLEFCLYWVEQIRELLEPTRKMPLRGVACGHCGFESIREPNPEGETVRRPAILVYPDERPTRAECQVCGEQWVGELSLQLLALASAAAT